MENEKNYTNSLTINIKLKQSITTKNKYYLIVSTLPSYFDNSLTITFVLPLTTPSTHYQLEQLFKNLTPHQIFSLYSNPSQLIKTITNNYKVINNKFTY